MRKDLSCHVVLKFLRTTDVTTCMRDCTDNCHGLLFNELERNCTLCASVKIETGNPDKKATAFEKVKKKCGDQTPSDSTKTSQKLCPPFENKKNGKVVGESLLEGATKNLTCHPGYSPRDRNNVMSQCKNSQWTKITECAIVCPTFENINNGKVEGDTLFEGATRNLTCNPGFSPRDSNAVLSLCQNGQWTKITECIKDCPQFITPKYAAVEGESIYVGSTRTLKCDNNYKPVNESKITSVCDNGMWSSITRCVPDKWEYRAFEFNQSIYVFTNQSDTFAKAVAFCKEGDGHVVTIDDETEQHWVKTTAPIVNALDDFWLGITETEVPNKFTRIHDEANLSYYNWASGQPNNAGGDQRCVDVLRGSQWAWNDAFCTDIRFIVCEVPN
ncbi:hypothetical protein DPMN_061236 [Dreissena polymorpha]|uniref:Uncharacterized protein n=1 Tax=Dreissena polymorpha TaxID=45954 RepID=A0A9D4C783_DREPO|nr:hypothetical protein DPMN_061236 [Dreissena polymorpha]